MFFKEVSKLALSYFCDIFAEIQIKFHYLLFECIDIVCDFVSSEHAFRATVP